MVELVIMKVDLGEIISDNNRKYTKDEGFEQLVNSIADLGVLEPPIVRMLPDGKFRVVAGRRRVAAFKKLGKKDEYFIVIPEDDPRSDDEIALTENVNRADMHPIDEADLFDYHAKKGESVEMIAKYYARSPSSIYKRLRLVKLTDGLRGMFRDEKIDIADAAVLAELPVEDQEEFFEIYHNKDGDIASNAITSFIRKKQRFGIYRTMKGCKECKDRTHNENNQLFKEYEFFDDVCLNGDCYRLKWYEMISAALGRKYRESPDTDNKIYFSDGIPKLLYKEASQARYTIGKEEVQFDVLRTDKYEFTDEETKRKDEACWEIRSNYEGKLIVERVGYKKKQPKEKIEAAGANDNKEKANIEEYGKEIINELCVRLDDAKPAELVKKIKEKKVDRWDFRGKIDERVLDKIIKRRLELDKDESKPIQDYFSSCLEAFTDFSYGSFKNFNKQQKIWYKDMFGDKTLEQIAAGLSREIQKLFHFILLSLDILDEQVPDIACLKSLKNDDLFLTYAGMSKAEYRQLYIDAAEEATNEILGVKPKKKQPGDVDPDMEISDDTSTEDQE
jgi:ParB/RepB/Spo0J family partition protein